MLTVLKFFRIVCLVLLAGSIVISTKYILEAYLPGQEDADLNTALLHWISWYVTAPLLLLFSILKGIENWFNARD